MVLPQGVAAGVISGFGAGTDLRRNRGRQEPTMTIRRMERVLQKLPDNHSRR